MPGWVSFVRGSQLDPRRKSSNNRARFQAGIVPSYSHSKLAAFDQCPLKYKFRYVEEIPPPVRSIELHLGDSVHRSLETLYSEARQERTLSSDDFLALFQQKWDEGYTPELRIVRAGTTARTYLESGRKMLAAYHRRFHPFRQTVTL